jgi:hypothetical protein
MKLSEFNKLKKLMMMTTSDNDQEVLTAVRSANRILAAHNYNWDSTFGKLVKVEDGYPDFDEGPSRDENAIIREAFDEVEASDPKGSFANFIASLREQFEKKNYLTVNQKEALFSARDRARSRR